MVVTTLLCYAPEDKRLVDRLKKHLSMLERREHISLWDHGHISPGAVREQAIDKHFNEAQMILLFMSVSFLSSDYHYHAEMLRAIDRHERQESLVIPILLSPVHWYLPPIDKLMPLPDGAKPIIEWRPQDKGFKNVVDGISRVIEQRNAHSFSVSTAERRKMIVNLDQLVGAIKVQMQPQPRADATASTFQQLSVLVPNDVTLADLVVGWRTLSHSFVQGTEHPATTQRRVTCGELANIASQFVIEPGNLAQAIKTWDVWQDAFTKRDDPRQVAMIKTFKRELTELQATLHSSDI